MLRFKGVSVNFLRTFKNCITCMKIDSLFAGNKTHGFVKVSHKFFRISCFARIISRCLNTTGKLSVNVVKTVYVITLPTMNTNRYVVELFESFFCINIVFFVKFTNRFKIYHKKNSSYTHIFIKLYIICKNKSTI